MLGRCPPDEIGSWESFWPFKNDVNDPLSAPEWNWGSINYQTVS